MRDRGRGGGRVGGEECKALCAPCGHLIGDMNVCYACIYSSHPNPSSIRRRSCTILGLQTALLHAVSYWHAIPLTSQILIQSSILSPIQPHLISHPISHPIPYPISHIPYPISHIPYPISHHIASHLIPSHPIPAHPIHVPYKNHHRGDRQPLVATSQPHCAPLSSAGTVSVYQT